MPTPSEATCVACGAPLYFGGVVFHHVNCNGCDAAWVARGSHRELTVNPLCKCTHRGLHAVDVAQVSTVSLIDELLDHPQLWESA